MKKLLRTTGILGVVLSILVVTLSSTAGAVETIPTSTPQPEPAIYTPDLGAMNVSTFAPWPSSFNAQLPEELRQAFPTTSPDTGDFAQLTLSEAKMLAERVQTREDKPRLRYVFARTTQAVVVDIYVSSKIGLVVSLVPTSETSGGLFVPSVATVFLVPTQGDDLLAIVDGLGGYHKEFPVVAAPSSSSQAAASPSAVTSGQCEITCDVLQATGYLATSTTCFVIGILLLTGAPEVAFVVATVCSQIQTAVGIAIQQWCKNLPPVACDEFLMIYAGACPLWQYCQAEALAGSASKILGGEQFVVDFYAPVPDNLNQWMVTTKTHAGMHGLIGHVEGTNIRTWNISTSTYGYSGEYGVVCAPIATLQVDAIWTDGSRTSNYRVVTKSVDPTCPRQATPSIPWPYVGFDPNYDVSISSPAGKLQASGSILLGTEPELTIEGVTNPGGNPRRVDTSVRLVTDPVTCEGTGDLIEQLELEFRLRSDGDPKLLVEGGGVNAGEAENCL